MSTTSEPDDFIVELFERSRDVVGLEAPQVEAWVSGLFGLWEGDGDARRFVDHCRLAGDQAGALLCRAIAELDSGAVGQAARGVADDLAGVMPSEGEAIGASAARAAWRVSAPFGQSVIIGFGARDQSDHALLVELDPQGRIADLLLSGPPEELLAELRPPDPSVAGDEDERDHRARSMSIEALTVETAASVVADAWCSSASAPQAYDESVTANARFVQRRIETIIGASLPQLQQRAPDVDPLRGMSQRDFDEANRAACSTVVAALTGPPDAPDTAPEVVEAWIEVIRAEPEGGSVREIEALHWLEWADWLGAGIGLVREGAGAPLDGTALVDHVNRCPEVSSSIAAADREYAAAAFELAIDHVAAVGAVEQGELTEVGHRSLHAALFAAWSEWNPTGLDMPAASDQ